MPEDVFKRIDAAAEAMKDQLVKLSLQIHAHPEIAFQEKQSAAWLCELLAGAGFTVQKPVAGLETAFRADWQGSGVKGAGAAVSETGTPAGRVPTVAILAEYDALPEVGHACGHNIIGVAAAGAGIALKQAVPDLAGRVVVMGTPAEEGGGGKIIMVNAGLFDDVDAAIMVHPTAGESKIGSTSLATHSIVFNFHGRPAHAAASPHLGINALDAVVQTYVNVSMLRQHMTPDARVHCLITKGGSVINIVPEEAEIRYVLRANTKENLATLVAKVKECAEGAARATGATLRMEEKVGYGARRLNIPLGNAFKAQLRRAGLEVADEPSASGGSTDFGDVSQKVPAANAYVSIASKGVAGHSREFALAAASDAGVVALMASVKAMAATVLAALTDAELRAKMKEAHQA